MPRFSEENFQFNLTLVDKFDEIAKKYSATSSQLALAWILAKHPDMVPIPGSKSVARLDENASAAKITLTEDDFKALDEAVASADVKGARKPTMPDYFSNDSCIPLSEWKGE